MASSMSMEVSNTSTLLCSSPRVNKTEIYTCVFRLARASKHTCVFRLARIYICMHPANLRPPQMAVAVDHRYMFKPPARNRRHRRLSSPLIDLNQLDLVPPNPSHLRSPKRTIPSPTGPPKFLRSLSTPCLYSGKSATIVETSQADRYAGRVEIVLGKSAPGVNAFVIETAIAMASGARPVPVPGGARGVYYLLNRAGETFAVLKSVNDEPVGLSLGQPGLRRSISVGETGVREVAAYLLDHGGFSGVPPTALVKLPDNAFQLPNSTLSTARSHRIASIQRFIPHEFDAGDLGPSRFSITSVHRIGILDIRLLNVDRHSGNILVKTSAPISMGKNETGTPAELIPIDHGLCLPELLDEPYFEWLHWPQARVPFSEYEINYVASLDPWKDADLLRRELPLLKEPSIRILILCTLFLKHAVAAGFVLADIADMMTPKSSVIDGDSSSVLEKLCREVERYNSMFCFDTDDVEKSHESEEEEFLFDMDINTEESEMSDFGKLATTSHQLLKQKTSSFLSTCNRYGNGEHGEEELGGGGGEVKGIGSLTKSMSFSMSDQSYHGKCISFKGMSDEEWRVFLERFEELTNEVLEERKNLKLGLMKQRLGSSCKF